MKRSICNHMSVPVTGAPSSCITLPSITIHKLRFASPCVVRSLIDASIEMTTGQLTSRPQHRDTYCYHLSLSVATDRYDFSSWFDHSALSPPLHAFSSETPNSIINSRLFLERLRTRISGMCEARAETLSHLGQV